MIVHVMYVPSEGESVVTTLSVVDIVSIVVTRAENDNLSLDRYCTYYLKSKERHLGSSPRR